MKKIITILVGIMLSITALYCQSRNKPISMRLNNELEPISNLDSQNRSANTLEDYNSAPTWANTEQLADLDDSAKVFKIIALEVDNDGNTYFIGYSAGENEYQGHNFSNNGIFIIKKDVNGSVLWVNQIENSSLMLYAIGNKMVINKESGDILFGGSFEETISVGGVELIPSDDVDFFVASFDTDGNVNWATSIGPVDDIYSVALDSDNNAIITGTFSIDLELAGSSFTNFGALDVFLIKIDNTGTISWASQLGGESYEWLGLISLDTNNDIYLTGEFYSRDIFISNDTSLSLTETDGDILLCKFTNDGEFLWAKAYGGSEDDIYLRYDCFPTGIQSSSNGVYMTGWYGNGANFGDTTLYSATLSSYDIGRFASKFDQDGNILWIQSMEGTLNLYAEMDIDNEGNLYVTSNFQDTITLGSAELISSKKDVFYAKYSNEGILDWVKTIPGKSNYSGYAYPTGMAVTDVDHLVVSGYFKPNQSQGSFDEYYSLTFDEVEYQSRGASSYVASLCGGLTDLNLTEENETLIAPSAVAYQWFFENESIDGATDQTYSLTEEGEYYVTITVQNGCTYTSDVYSYIPPLEIELSSDNKILIYPNPTSNELIINLPNKSSQLKEVIVQDINGKVVANSKFDTYVDSSINVSSLTAGIYLITIKTESRIEKMKFIKR